MKYRGVHRPTDRQVAKVLAALIGAALGGLVVLTYVAQAWLASVISGFVR